MNESTNESHNLPFGHDDNPIIEIGFCSDKIKNLHSRIIDYCNLKRLMIIKP
jgi:hypothetical protein